MVNADKMRKDVDDKNAKFAALSGSQPGVSSAWISTTERLQKGEETGGKEESRGGGARKGAKLAQMSLKKRVCVPAALAQRRLTFKG